MSTPTDQPGAEHAGTTPPPPPPTPPRPRLERPREGRTIFGVCAALGRYTDVDPVIYRVILVVLAIFGGLGLALYAVGWLLIPEEGEPSSKLERLARRHVHRWRNPAGAAIAIGALIFLAVLTASSTRNTAVTVALLALVAYLVLRRPHVGGPPAPATEGPPPAAWWSAEYAGQAAGPAAETAPDRAADTAPAASAAEAPQAPARAWVAPPPPPPPMWQPPSRRPHSPLGLLTLSTSLIVGGVLTAFREAGVDSLTAPRILAAMLAVVASGLVVGAWIGRARWLVVPGAVLAALAVGTASLGVPLSGGVGQRVWTPTSAADLQPAYHLAIGDATMDLSALADGTTATTVTATVGIGRLLVVVPRNVAVHVRARSGAGAVVVFGQTTNGIGPDMVIDRGPVVAGGGGLVDVVARVGLGRVEVTRATP